MNRCIKLLLAITASTSLIATHPARSAEVEVLAIQAGVLPPSPHGAGKGELPREMSVNPFEFGEWPSGTGVLLRTKLPDGAILAPGQHTLVSFNDNGGKNLAKLPEGTVTSHFPNGVFKPVSAILDEKTMDVCIAVRSLKSPNKKATVLSGEVLLSISAGAPTKVESISFLPSRGKIVNVGPFVFNILNYDRPTQEVHGPRNMPPGFPAPPAMPANMKSLQYSIATAKTPGTKITSIEILDSNGAVLSKTDKMEFVIGNGHSYGVSFQDTGMIKIRVAVIDPAQVTSVPIKFETSLGVSEE